MRNRAGHCHDNIQQLGRFLLLLGSQVGAVALLKLLADTVEGSGVRRILFVDDQSVVLDGLRSMLRKQRHEWHMNFVTDGEAALVALREERYDVVITDMRMPGMDGAELLRRVVVEHPHVVRIVLSGQTELEASRRVLHVAHQFLAKPCDSSMLRSTVDRTCRLSALLGDSALRETVGGVAQLPTRPKAYGQLVEVLEKPGSSMTEAAVVVERDPAITAKLLQLVNSAFFGLPRRVADVKTAVSYLGVDMLKTLVLDIGIRQAQGGATVCPDFDATVVQRQGLLSARIARRLLDDRLDAMDAFTAAMLKDVGWLVLLSRLPDGFRAAVAAARATGRSLADVGEERLGVSHAMIGAYLLGIWGLPYAIVEAVAHHRAPGQVDSNRLDVVGAVHVAAALAEEVSPSGTARHVGGGVQLDERYVDGLGLTSWRLRWTLDYACRDDYGCTLAQCSAFAALHLLARHLHRMRAVRGDRPCPEGNPRPPPR